MTVKGGDAMAEKKDLGPPQRVKPKKYPHEGHRERMRKRFRANGLVGFSDFEALELFLFYAIPRRDTRPIAHALIEDFGSLTAVFNAPEESLCRVPGVGPKTARYLHSICGLWKFLRLLPTKSHPVDGIAETLAWSLGRMRLLRPPLYFVVLLDDANHITYHNYITGDEMPTFAAMMRTLGLHTEKQITIIEWGTGSSHAVTQEHTAQVRRLAENLRRIGYILWDYIALPALDEKPLFYRRRGQLINI